MKLQERDKSLLRHLRRNARASLAEVAIALDVPKSTLYDRLRRLERSIVKRHASILDFERLGMHTVLITFKVAAADKQRLRESLEGHPNLNSLLTILYGHDFAAEFVFANRTDVDAFMEDAHDSYAHLETQVFHVTDIKREHYTP